MERVDVRLEGISVGGDSDDELPPQTEDPFDAALREVDDHERTLRSGRTVYDEDDPFDAALLEVERHERWFDRPSTADKSRPTTADKSRAATADRRPPSTAGLPVPRPRSARSITIDCDEPTTSTERSTTSQRVRQAGGVVDYAEPLDLVERCANHRADANTPTSVRPTAGKENCTGTNVFDRLTRPAPKREPRGPSTGKPTAEVRGVPSEVPLAKPSAPAGWLEATIRATQSHGEAVTGRRVRLPGTPGFVRSQK